MTAPIRVVKLGGRALAAPGALAAFATSLAASRDATVVVHGGGHDVSAWCDRLGLPARFHDGLRVTDAATLDVAVAVLAGLANKRLVAALRAAGVNAVGIAALDGGLLEAAPHADAARLGAVGAIHRADPGVVQSLLAAGRVPVVASIGAHAGQLLNLNADDAAAAIATALGAADLLLLSDTPGVRLAGTLVSQLDAAALDAAIDHPDVRDGMQAKLRAARTALAAGVARIRIADWRGPATLATTDRDLGHGTCIAATAIA